MTRDAYDGDEEPTGRRAPQAQRVLALGQWRQLVGVFDSLPDSAARERLLAHVVRWAELEADSQVLVHAVALRLP